MAEVESHYVHLDDETLDDEEINRRRNLGARILERIPLEAISRLQILQPAIGCLNRCNFCSQVAGPVTRELGARSLRTVMGGLRGAMLTAGLDRVGGDRMHKDGVIFPYLDNDIGSYPHLPDYLVGMRSLGGRTRISTVGWSRHNAELQEMHGKIAAEHTNDIDGVRFSFTPYTYGWRTKPDEYISDFSNALSTYRPLFEEKGVGRRTACVEMRFAPDIQLGSIEYKDIGDYSIVRCGEYELVTRQGELQQVGFSAITDMTEEGPQLNNEGTDALHILGRTSDLTEDALTTLFDKASDKKLTANEGLGVLAQRGKAHVFQNSDGPYFCFNPLKDPRDGNFTAVHYYPKTETRKESGVLDASRPFLNNLLAIKQDNGVGPREDYDAATWIEVDELLDNMRSEADTVGRYSQRRGRYIKEHVVPLAEGVIEAMRGAGLNAADLFRYGLVVDTGVIVNQGKAITEFQGLASQPDMPMTPNEEKGYGDVSQSSIRGNTWRISPIALLDQSLSASGYGRKSLPMASASGNGLSLGVFEWNPQTFANKNTGGERLRSFHIPINDLVDSLDKITPGRGQREYRLPGV